MALYAGKIDNAPPLTSYGVLFHSLKIKRSCTTAKPHLPINGCPPKLKARKQGTLIREASKRLKVIFVVLQTSTGMYSGRRLFDQMRSKLMGLASKLNATYDRNQLLITFSTKS